MKCLLHTLTILFFVFAAFFAAPNTVLASEGDDGHGMEVEVNGYHVTLASQNEWAKGGNVVIVKITDETGMPVRDAEVGILIAPKADSHAGSETDAHGESATDEHKSESSAHDAMAELDEHEDERTDSMAHEEDTVTPLVMTASHEHGEYVVETHIEKSGPHDVQVLFHVNGQMKQANFTIDVLGTSSKTVALWSFLLINIGLVVTAGVMKNQTGTVKGK